MSDNQVIPEVRALRGRPSQASYQPLQEPGVSDERRVPIHRTSESLQSYKNIPEQQVTVATVEDLEALCVRYGEPIILTVGEGGKLSSIEIYDDYRE